MSSRSKPEPVLSIERFFTGLVSQRSPLNTPFMYAGLNIIQRNDALISGLNTEISNNFTLQRRPGFPRYCLQEFAGGEFPLDWDSFRINGQVVNIVDTNVAVYTFTPTTLTLLFTKSAGAGQTFFQQIGNVLYFANGVDNKKWVPSGLSWAATTTFTAGQFITDPNGNTQQVTTGGTSGGSQPVWNVSVRGTTTDGSVTWTNRGNQVSNWGIASPGSAPTVTPTLSAGTASAGSATRFWAPGITFTNGSGDYTIIDSNGNVQLLTTAASQTTGTTPPTWSPILNAVTSDGTINNWGNFGPPLAWQASTLYGRTAGGTTAAIIDSNNNLQYANLQGTSGATAPAWNVTFGGNTVDNTVTWKNGGPANFLAFAGYQWCYAYHTVYGHVSTASPMTLTTNPIIGSTFTYPVTGTGSADPQCDFIWIFRVSDGGAVFEFAGQIANPGASPFTFTDTTVDANLNNQLVAPLAHSNDPPPAGLKYLTWYMKRMWGAVGNKMQFGLGPDVLTGVAEESWPPANFETYATTVQVMAGTSQGLCVLTNDQWWVEMGGPQTLSFYPQHVLDNFGVSSPNCLAQNGDQLYVYSSSRQLWSLSLGTGQQEDGFAVGDIMLSTFNPATSYLALHQNGTDSGLFLSDGVGNMLRLSAKLDAWGTLYQIVGGVGAIQSIETAFGTYTLLAGRPTGGGFILGRSLTAFYDDQVADVYPFNAQIGSLKLSRPGSPTEDVQTIVLVTTTAGSQLSVGVLINEVAGAPINVPVTESNNQPVSDPYDTPPQTLRSLRYDLNGMQGQVPNTIRHMQVNISGIPENAKSEILELHLCPQVQ